MPTALASIPSGVVVGSSRGVDLLQPFHPSLPSQSPKTPDDFSALYAAIGLRVSPDDGTLELV